MAETLQDHLRETERPPEAGHEAMVQQAFAETEQAKKNTVELRGLDREIQEEQTRLQHPSPLPSDLPKRQTSINPREKITRNTSIIPRRDTPLGKYARKNSEGNEPPSKPSRLRSTGEIREYNELRSRERKWLMQEGKRIREEGSRDVRQAVGVSAKQQVRAKNRAREADLRGARNRLSSAQKLGIEEYRQALEEEMGKMAA